MPLRTLFVDMNSYFASCEQHLRPELRGKPVAVAALDADTTSCIAASYEAKRFGVRTGTPVWEARAVPGMHIVVARAREYIKLHHQILVAVDTVLPVHQVHSIDEFSCRLEPRESDPRIAQQTAHRVKQAIYSQVGPQLRCSVGLAPNPFLAKVATDMQKPDGLITLDHADLPPNPDSPLYKLKLNDFPGIGPRMLKRLHSAGVASTFQLCQLSPDALNKAFGSVWGSRWYHLLRGDDLSHLLTHRSSVSQSHVLPPDQRNDAGAHAILTRLVHKAAARLRTLRYSATKLTLSLSYSNRQHWHATLPLGNSDDTLTFLQAFNTLWSQRPPNPDFSLPRKVGITLHHLTSPQSTPLPLFPEAQHRARLSKTLDTLNTKFGPHTLYFAGMHTARTPNSPRIAFNHIPDLNL